MFEDGNLFGLLWIIINGKILILMQNNGNKNGKILDLKVEMDLRYLARMEPPTSEQHLS